jgi:hypothetical protein
MPAPKSWSFEAEVCTTTPPSVRKSLRELKGLKIKARSKLVFADGANLVPSQAGPLNKHRETLDSVNCSCEGLRLLLQPGKHVHARRLACERDIHRFHGSWPNRWQTPRRKKNRHRFSDFFPARTATNRPAWTAALVCRSRLRLSSAVTWVCLNTRPAGNRLSCVGHVLCEKAIGSHCNN